MSIPLETSNVSKRSLFVVRIKKLFTTKVVLNASTAGLVGYAIVRAIPVWGVMQNYGVNVWIFLAIDIITAIPYPRVVYRMIRALSAAKTKLSMLWGCVFIVLLVAPYVYVYAAGGPSMPVWLLVVVTLIIVTILIVGPVREITKKLRGTSI